MTLPLLTLSPNGSKDRTGVLSPTITGAIRTVPYDGTTAWFTEEGTTNLFIDPYFQGVISSTGTTVSAGPCTVTSVIDGTRNTRQAISTSTVGFGMESTSAGLVSDPDVVVGQTYTFSAWVKTVTGIGAVRLRIRWFNSSNGLISDTLSSDVVASTNGQTMQVTGVAPTGATHAHLGVVQVTTGLALGNTFRSAEWQFENKAYATSFCPQYTSGGSLMIGYTWNGTVHVSTSTRTTATISLPEITGYDFRIGSWYLRFSINSPAKDAFVISSGNQSGQPGFIAIDSYTDSHLYYSGGVGTSFWIDTPFTTNTNLNSYYWWSGTQFGATLNGATVAGIRTAASTNIGAQNIKLNPSTLAGSFNIAAAIAYERPLTVPEIAKLNATPTERLTQWGLLQPSIGGMLKTTSVDPIGVIRTTFGSINPPS